MHFHQHRGCDKGLQPHLFVLLTEVDNEGFSSHSNAKVQKIYITMSALWIDFTVEIRDALLS
jgi:hypothetical protein